MSMAGATSPRFFPFVRSFVSSSPNLDSRLSEMRATKRTNQTFPCANKQRVSTLSHTRPENNLYIYARQ